MAEHGLTHAQMLRKLAGLRAAAVLIKLSVPIGTEERVQ